MKLEYFYDGQFRRLLKHLIRMFGEFKVQNGVDSNGDVKYKTVPCRYADLNRITAYILAGGSENVLPSAPNMTISVQNLKMDRKNIRAPMQYSTVMGTNKSPEPNVYTKELDKQYHITRYNPTPWILTFNVNIWTTNLTNKLELWEQIATLFNPALTLQLSDNPMDWTSAIDVELTDCQFSTRGFPQGTEEDLDMMTLTFECPLWLSLPARVKEATLVQQIVTNINTAKDELNIDLENYYGAVTDVYTPKNMCVLVDRVSSDSSTEMYRVKLVSSSLNEFSTNGKVYSWERYLEYLEPDFKDKSMYLKFQQSIEDSNPIKADIVSLPDDETPNILTVKVDTSAYKGNYTIENFILESTELFTAQNGFYVCLSETNIKYNSFIIKPDSLFELKDGIIEIINPEDIGDYIYNKSDMYYYKYNSVLGWYQSVQNKYRQGYWRIAFVG